MPTIFKRPLSTEDNEPSLCNKRRRESGAFKKRENMRVRVQILHRYKCLSSL